MGGIVHLVGAGPGDPGLLTLRGRELLSACDCVVYDSLVDEAVLAFAPSDAVRHHVGKRGGEASTPQEDIDRLLIACAGRHRVTVRLKGGDPFVFGRGGEECAALAGAGVPFTVVPGVTSGVAVPAYAGIPVTRRAASSAVAFVTGHRRRDAPDPLDLKAIAQVETIVLYMGMHRLAENCAQLIAYGRDPRSPAAIIQWGSTPRQRVVVSDLAGLPAAAITAGIGAPAITIVGEVVRLREELRWFDAQPLFGRHALVTRLGEDAGRLAGMLRAEGCAVSSARLAEHRPPASWVDLDAILAAPPGGAWLACTSRTAVEALWSRLRLSGGDARRLAGFRLAAVGPGSAEALAEHGLHADLVGASDGAELAERLIAGPGPRRCHWPRAAEARPAFARALRAAGWDLREAEAYATVASPPPADLPWEAIDLVPLTSAASVARLAAAYPAEVAAAARRGCRFVAIGRSTAEALIGAGLPMHALADSPSLPDLLAACRRSWACPPSPPAEAVC